MSLPPSPPPSPDPTVLDQLWRACKRNAADLIAEAELLCDNGHLARALALAYTALEELGKAHFVADVIEGTILAADLDVAFRDHRRKWAYMNRKVTWSASDGSDTAVSYERKDGEAPFAARTAALYVAFEAGRVIDPRDTATREQVRALIADCRHELSAINLISFVTGGGGTRSAVFFRENVK